MLKCLYIKNYALISSLEIDFTSGFSVITGETGAGKSIILGALSLILGQRADTKSIKQGESKCVIEGVFDVSAYDLKAFSEEHDIEYDSESYILRREILSSGKSRAFINDSPVTLTDLKVLGSRLIDIHSQHQNLLLADDQFQLQVVDILAKSKDILADYKRAYKQLKNAERVLAELKETISKSKEEEDYLRFQYETLHTTALIDGEQETLEAERESLIHAEEIKSGLYKCFQILSDDDRGIISGLKESVNTSHTLTKFYLRAGEIHQRLDAARIDLQDLSSDLERLSEDIEFNPERLTEVETRLDVIYTLQKKHKLDSIQQLLALCEELKAKISTLDLSDEQLQKQEQEVLKQQEITSRLALTLTKQRTASAMLIEKELVAKISVLGMPNVRFECHFQPKKVLDLSGADDLEFLFSANKNVPMQIASEIASGGEISRLMLCLKSMIAGATDLPSIIFDEVDTGVSGEIADKMGQIMQEFGQNMQVIAITHLPQIAAKGKVHYLVYKSDDSDITTTNLIRLSDEERLTEIARMLSGAKLTDAAIQNAKEMLGS